MCTNGNQLIQISTKANNLDWSPGSSRCRRRQQCSGSLMWTCWSCWRLVESAWSAFCWGWTALSSHSSPVKYQPCTCTVHVVGVRSGDLQRPPHNIMTCRKFQFLNMFLQHSCGLSRVSMFLCDSNHRGIFEHWGHRTTFSLYLYTILAQLNTGRDLACFPVLYIHAVFLQQQLVNSQSLSDLYELLLLHTGNTISKSDLIRFLSAVEVQHKWSG